MTKFRVKRIYDDPSPDDGVRLLVDRLWPRGITKEAARIDVWAKQLTPSHELRTWFHEHPEQLDDFKKRYEVELNKRLEYIARLFDDLAAKTITLVSATKHPENGHVAVLRMFLEHHVA